MTEPIQYLTDVQVAAMLGKNPVTVRKWRVKNTKAGCIKFGPPYEYHGHNVAYPKHLFHEWCSAVRVINGVPRINAPINSPFALPREVAHAA